VAGPRNPDDSNAGLASGSAAAATEGGGAAIVAQGFRPPKGLPRREATSIVTTSASIVGSALANSGLGFVFWLLAARGYAPAVVGLGSAIVSAMLLLAKLTSLGIGTSLAGALAERRVPPAGLLVPGLLVTGGLSLAVGLASGPLAALLSPELGVLGAPLATAVFAIGLALTAVGSVLDQALVGLRRPARLLWRNLAFAAGKLVLLAGAVAVGAESGLVIAAVWAGGEILSLALLALLDRPWAHLPRKIEWQAVREMHADAVAHHALNVSRFAPSLAMPLVVTTMFSAEMNGPFYLAYFIANGAQLVAASTTFSLYAAALRSPEHFTHQIRLTLLLSIGTVLPAIAFLIVFGTPLLAIFGATYAAQASQILPVLAVLALPLIVKDHWIALARIHRRVRTGALVTALAAALELAGGVIGGMLAGLPGLAAGWLAGSAVIAALQVPAVLRAARGLHPVNTRP
jgi:O-antigen/teichoic acid export membrane protein